MTPRQQEAYELRQSGMTRKQIADHMGISDSAAKHLLARAKVWLNSPSALTSGAKVIGADTPAKVVWTKTHKDGSITHSVMHSNSIDDETEFTESITSALQEYQPLDRKLFAPRVNIGAKGDKLLVVDLADVHFGKLCVQDETGHKYNVEVARHRVIEGTRALLNEVSGVARILFVMGNDILHTDNGKTSTAGTPQDSDGSYFTAWRAAQHASIDAIAECAAVAETDLVHCMSNHDWRSGWALSQTIAAAMSNHENVRATPYNMSERHRKYYGYGRNGFMLTHGDGAKEESLTSLFLKEARSMISKTDLLYAILHHFHHKKRNKRGLDVFMSEKDHTAFTQINMGAARVEGVDMVAEYVRSPSPPDGWHDRNGYVNRQAVEAFIHCPHDGQKARFTEWF
jgi:hypothetical protein